MYQRAARSLDLSVLHGATRVQQPVYRSSVLAAFCAAWLSVVFVAVTVVRVNGRLAHSDLRIVAHVVPVRYHPRLLALLHPLVHLGDLAFVIAVAVVMGAVLWWRGYRRCWALLLVSLSWPIELACKAVLPQPGDLGGSQGSMQARDLVHGAGTASVLQWLHRAAPESVGLFVRHAGSTTLNLISTYPSGSTARGAFVLGLLIWACLQLRILVLSELLAVVLLVPLGVLGFALVLFSWHWPSDVLGGYLLGFTLLAIALALLRRPVPGTPETAGPDTLAAGGVHSPVSRLPWVVSR